jgi:putative oxidoreductase
MRRWRTPIPTAPTSTTGITTEGPPLACASLRADRARGYAASARRAGRQRDDRAGAAAGGSMDRVLGSYSEPAYALFRIVVGFLFALHGAQKVLGLFGGVNEAGDTAPFGLIWVAGAIELVGGLLVATGFQAATAAFICSGQMAVAYFMAHQPRGLLPIQNGGELAALYSFAFLFIATKGTGIWGLGSRGK